MIFLQLSDVGELFGWAQAFLEQLGVWSTLQMGIQAIIIVSVTAALFRYFRA